MRTHKVVLIGAVGVTALLLTACTQSQVVQSLQVAITAAEIAVPIVAEQAHLDPVIKATVVAYLGSANSALSEVTAALNSGQSTAVIAARIVAAISAVPKANLPPGTPATIVSAINGVANALVGVLQNYLAPAGRAMAPMPSAPLKLTWSDKRAIGGAQARLGKNRIAIGKL